MSDLYDGQDRKRRAGRLKAVAIEAWKQVAPASPEDDPVAPIAPQGRPTRLAHPLFGPFGVQGADVLSMAVVDHPADGALSCAPPWQDAYLISVQLTGAVQRVCLEDDAAERRHDLEVGDMVIHDLRRRPRIRLDAPYSAFNLHIPRAVFDQVCDQARLGPFGDLDYEIGAPIRDETVRNIAHTLMPALRVPQGAGRFVQQLTLALVTHLARAHGGLTPGGSRPRVGLAPWQKRRAREALMANLHGRISLEAVARNCDLSLSLFSRAFRQSFGLPPYQFILKARVEAAKRLIRQHEMAIADIALACGFSDQSHMTRVFSKEVGVSPAVWQRIGLS